MIYTKLKVFGSKFYALNLVDGKIAKLKSLPNKTNYDI